MRELQAIAAWRRQTRNGKPFHPTHVGFWPLLLKLRASRPPVTSNGTFTAVLLVHRRPANLDSQIRATLHAPSVDRVVVSGNNPEVDPAEWTSVRSPRLQILRETGRNQTRRYDVALASGGEKFVLLDDDVLFTPDGVEDFCAALPADGSHPVGLAGQRLLASGLWESAIESDGEEVDVLNRAYVCTRQHAEGVFANARALGWSDEDTFSFPADDVLVSYTGAVAPTVHAVPHVNCVSHTDTAISTYRQSGFHAARSEWVEQLRALHTRGPARRDAATKGASASGAGATWAEPVRERYYRGRGVQPLSLLPRALRRTAGIDDYKALRSRRVQIGVSPAPLESFVRIDASHLPDAFGDEVVALGAPMDLAEWRRILRVGGRLVLGADHDTPFVALEANGFEVVAVVDDGTSLETHATVSPWTMPGDQGRVLDPIPAAVDGAAPVIVVARAR